MSRTTSGGAAKPRSVAGGSVSASRVRALSSYHRQAVLHPPASRPLRPALRNNGSGGPSARAVIGYLCKSVSVPVFCLCCQPFICVICVLSAAAFALIGVYLRPAASCVTISRSALQLRLLLGCGAAGPAGSGAARGPRCVTQLAHLTFGLRDLRAAGGRSFWMAAFIGATVRGEIRGLHGKSVHALRSAGVVSMRGQSRAPPAFCDCILPFTVSRTGSETARRAPAVPWRHRFPEAVLIVVAESAARIGEVGVPQVPRRG